MELLKQQTTQFNQYYKSLWKSFVMAMLVSGILISYRQVMQETITDWSFYIIAVPAVLLCIGGSYVPKVGRFSAAIPAIFAVLLALVFGLDRIYGGLCGSVNTILKLWNTEYEDGKALLAAGDITQSDVKAFSIILLLLLVAALWVMVERSMVFLCILGALLWLMSTLVVGCFSPVGAVLLIMGGLGIWIYQVYGGGVNPFRFGWYFGLVVYFLALALIFNAQSFTATQNMREEVKAAIHALRYGTDSLPEGNLYAAHRMFDNEDTTLTVTATKAKDLYLRGYIGGNYEDGIWQPLTGADYGGEYAGMFQWLEEQNLQPIAQYADYIQNNELPEDSDNQVTVENTGARREYFYAPYSIEAVADMEGSIEEDYQIRASGIWGGKTYSYTEWGSNLPSELLHVAQWVSNPKTEAQKQYVEAEKVYRSFVYEHYTTVDAQLAQLIDKMFWTDTADMKSESVYSATVHIREVLNEQVRYTKEAQAVPEEWDPISWFLTSAKEGNEALFASAAVEAYRAYGIPARYAEGYVVTEEALAQAEDGSVTLTGQDGHAWVEIYMDGIGWMPIDVTPGYYYDTYMLQQMVEQPSGITQTAAMEESDVQAGEIDSKDQILSEVVSTAGSVVGLFLLGLFVLACCIATLVFTGLELTRWRKQAYMRRQLNKKAGEERSRFLSAYVMYVLTALGMGARLGWQTQETGEKLADMIPDITSTEYVRASELMEKFYYGQIPLASYEERVLMNLIAKIYENKKKLGWRRRFRLRYGVGKL